MLKSTKGVSKSVSKNVPNNGKSVVLYEENVHMGWKFLAGGVVAWLAMAGFLVYSVLSPASSKEIWPYSVPVLLTLTFGFLLASYRLLKIRITSRDVELHFGPISNTVIERRHIISSAVTTTGFAQYLSIGPRRSIDGTRAYITSFGPAVLLERRNEAPFVFSSRNPEEICALLERPGKKK